MCGCIPGGRGGTTGSGSACAPRSEDSGRAGPERPCREAAAGGGKGQGMGRLGGGWVGRVGGGGARERSRSAAAAAPVRGHGGQTPDRSSHGESAAGDSGGGRVMAAGSGRSRRAVRGVVLSRATTHSGSSPAGRLTSSWSWSLAPLCFRCCKTKETRKC